MIFKDEEGKKWVTNEEFTEFLISRNSGPEKVIKPLKEAEKENYTLTFGTWSNGETLFSGSLTPNTAKSVAEAIEALMNYVQSKELHPEYKYEEAKKAYKEEQDD